MKATELRLGDWLLYEGEIAKVFGIELDRCSIADDEYSYIDTVWYDDLTPIPLTEEILEKNGWKKQCSNLDTPGWSNNHVKLYPQDKKFGGGFSFFYSGNSVQYIHHVHQLQHLLWALGLDDDLKI